MNCVEIMKKIILYTDNQRAKDEKSSNVTNRTKKIKKNLASNYKIWPGA